MKKVKEKEKFRLRPDMLAKGELIALSILIATMFPVVRMSGVMCASFLSIPVILYVFICGVFLIGFEHSVYKMVIFRIKRDQYQNAADLFKRAMLVAFLASVIIIAVLGLFAGNIMNGLYHLERGYLVLWLILPGILFVSVQGCIRGYLHGMGYTIQNFVSMMILGVSSIVLTIVLSIFANSYGVKVNALLHVDYISRFYTACVCMISFSVGALLSLIYITSFYETKKKEIAIYIKTGATKFLDSKLEVFENLKYSLPVMIVSFFVMLIDIRLYVKGIVDEDESTIAMSDLGVLTGKILPVLLIATFLLLLTIIKKWYQVDAAYKKDKKDIASILFGQIFHSTIRTFIPVAVFVMFTADIILEVVYGSSTNDEASLLAFSAFFIVVFSLFVFLQWFVIRLEHTGLNLIGVAIYGGVTLILSCIMIAGMGKGLHAIMLAFGIAMLIYDLVFFKLISTMLDFSLDDLYRPLVVIIASIVSGVVALILKSALRYVIGEILTLTVCLVVAYFVYVMILAFMRGIERYSLSKLPLGNFFIKLTNMSSRRISE